MNIYLILAGILNLLVAILHLIIIYKGVTWYQYFGAGDKLVALEKKGSKVPAIITFIIAIIFMLWALYAFSAAQLIGELPLLVMGIYLITLIYLLRGIGLIVLYIIKPLKVDGFMRYSSLISFVIGIIHLKGVLDM
jgi:fatty acid desaturase